MNLSSIQSNWSLMLTVRGIGIVYGMGYSNKNRMPKMAQIYRVAQNVSY